MEENSNHPKQEHKNLPPFVVPPTAVLAVLEGWLFYFASLLPCVKEDDLSYISSLKKVRAETEAETTKKGLLLLACSGWRLGYLLYAMQDHQSRMAPLQ